MKSIIGLTLASAAIASAQAGITENYPGNQTCPKANAAYCDGESLKTNIIIRCSKAGVEGQAGNCAANLSGQPPIGSSPARCYQSSPEAGDAACEKNCVVYASSSSFTLPISLCTPTYTASSTTPTASTTKSTTTIPTSHTTVITYKPTTTSTSDCESTTIYVNPSGTHPHQNNSTLITKSTTIYTNPTGPTAKPSVTTAGAVANQAVGGLAAMGLFAAYLL